MRHYPPRPGSVTNGIAFVVIVAGMVGCKSKPKDSPPLRPAVLSLEIKASAAAPLEVRGTVVPRARLKLGFRGPGILKTITVRQGDVVKKGAVLATVDAADAKARIREASLAFDKASREVQRTSTLVQNGALPARAGEDAHSELTSARAALDAARENARASRIVAPVGGTVFARLAEPGEALAPGAPVIALDDVSAYVVKLSLTLRDAERARTATEVTLIGPSGASLGAAKMNSVGSVPSAATGLYEVEIAAPMLLRAGELVTVRFEVPAQAGVLRIPFDAVVHARAGSEVLVIEGSGARAVVRRRAVDVDRLESNAAVLRAGLREGERIVREGADFLRDGDAVEIVD